jgi:predicted Ser/Thr protein kinase
MTRIGLSSNSRYSVMTRIGQSSNSRYNVMTRVRFLYFIGYGDESIKPKHVASATDADGYILLLLIYSVAGCVLLARL